MNLIAAFILLAHGIAHLVGFFAAWALLPMEKVPHVTTVFGDRFDLGEVGIRVVGGFWLLAATAFVVAAAATAQRVAWWPGFTAAVTAASLILCVLNWPQARMGVYVNLAILAILMVARLRSDW
jgi:hypothetical protein